MSSSKWITEKVAELDELTVKAELAFILQKYTEIGIQGYKDEDLIKEIKKLYIKLGMDRD